MYRMLERVVGGLCLSAGCRRDALARVERSLAHVLVLLCIANRLPMMLRCLEGIIREVRGV